MATPNTDAFLVGWITALRHELAAARSVLDEEFSEAPSDFTPPISDTNTYTWGRVGKHNVVVTSLPEGVYGPPSAAEVASRLSGSLPKLRFGLMVGIGAGIPARGKDIRLGDVVVSKPTGTTGGVVQYDSLKAKAENGQRRDERIGHLARPPAVLLTALTKWGSTSDMGESMVQDIIPAVFEKRPRMRKTFGYPGCAKDPFRSGLSVEKDTRRESPEIHLGVIASGHTLIKAAEERDRIVHWLNKEHIHPLCFKMEAVGLMDAFPCLVIRGICDYADENKNDDWQRYAALTAACFAKELLHHVDAATLQREDSLAQRLKSVENSVKQIQHDTAFVSKHDVTEEFEALLNWISPEDYSGRLHDEKRRHQKGTAQWVLNNPKYKAWIRDQEPSATRELFCHGRQGTGKTTIAAVIIQDLLDGSDDQNYAVMYVFFNHKQHGVQTYEHVLATLLRQLLHARQTSAHVATCMHEKHTRHNTRPTSEELEEALQATVTSVKGAFVVLDALDECHTNVTRPVFERLVPMLKACHVRLLSTARQTPAIEAQFTEAQKIHIEASSEDLTLYAREQVKARLPTYLASNAQLTERIVQHVVQVCAGIFLIARLTMESLVLLDTVADIHHCLEAIPYGEDGLKYLHQKALERIQGLPRPGQVHRALEALVWIVYSKRILEHKELEHALAFGPDDTVLNVDAIAPADIIVDQCAGLIRIDEESGTVRVTHETTQRYLEDFLPGYLPYKPHTLLACKCIAYATIDDLANTVFKDYEIMRRYLLYEYAIDYWVDHAEDVEQQSDQHEFDRFFSRFRRIEQAASALSSTIKVLPWNYDPDDRFLISSNITVWHVLAARNLAERHGSVDVAKLLLESGCGDAMAYDGYQNSPLWYAATTGKVEMVALLLQACSVQRQLWKDSYGSVLINEAASNGHSKVVDILLNAAKDAIGAGQFSERLEVAARESARAVENTGCTTHDAGDFNQLVNKALWKAVYYGHDRIVNMLIATHHADVNSKDEYGNSGLHEAARRGHESIVRLFLSQAKLDVNLRNNERFVPLHEAQYGRIRSHEDEKTTARYHRIIVALLGSKGIGVSARNVFGETPLTLAAVIKDEVAWGAIEASLSDSPLRLQNAMQYAYALHVVRQKALQCQFSECPNSSADDFTEALPHNGTFLDKLRLISKDCDGMKRLQAMPASDGLMLLLYMSDLVSCRSCGRAALHQGFHCRVCVDLKQRLERFGRDQFLRDGLLYKDMAQEVCDASNLCLDCASHGCLAESTAVRLGQLHPRKRDGLNTSQCGTRPGHLLQWVDAEPLLEHKFGDFIAPYEVPPLKISRSSCDVRAWKARLELMEEEQRRKMDLAYEMLETDNVYGSRFSHLGQMRLHRRCELLRCDKDAGKHSPWCLQVINDQENPGEIQHSISAETPHQEYLDLSSSSEELIDLSSLSQEDSNLSS